ncbi:MAG TPA: PfkB family carbohydrate kinase [Opitutaceae bacterium]
MSFDVLCCGMLCADLAFRVARQPGADEKMQAEALLLCGGGPAANAAVQVARLGGRAAFLGRVGRDGLGAQLRAELESERVDVRGLLDVGEATAAAAQLIKPDGARSVVAYRRPPTAVPRPREPRATDAAVLLVDGHEPAWSEALVAEARAAGHATLLDAGSLNAGTRMLAHQVDHVVASEAFARAWLGTDPTPDGLVAIGRREATVVVTLGARGLWWRRGGESGTVPAFRVDVVDTTGAGDAFHGAYALGLARRLAWRDLLREASAAGALACARFGARPALATCAELEAFLGTTGPD